MADSDRLKEMKATLADVEAELLRRKMEKIASGERELDDVGDVGDDGGEDDPEK